MIRRLTDTYFVKCSFSIYFETYSHKLRAKTSTGIYVIPQTESISTYIEKVTERQVKHIHGNDYEIADFAIIEITPL